MGKQNEKLFKNIEIYEQKELNKAERAIHHDKAKTRQKPVKGK